MLYQISPAARGFGSNGDRADDAGTGREDQTNRRGTNYIGSNSESIGTTGRGARPRQNSCQSAKLIRVSVGTPWSSPTRLMPRVSVHPADETSCRPK